MRKRKPKEPKETESAPKEPAASWQAKVLLHCVSRRTAKAPKRSGPLLSQRGNKKAKAAAFLLARFPCYAVRKTQYLS